MPAAEGGPRPFVDRGVGDVAVAADAARRAAAAWRLPAPELVRVGMNALFTAGDVVLRVGRPNAPASAAFALGRVLARHGVRVPEPVVERVVEHRGVTVTAWERLQPVASEPDWHAIGAMVGRVHDLDPRELPAEYPLPPCTSFPWWRFDELLTEVGTLADERARAALADAVRRHEGWQTARPWVVCHGDVHPGNVMATVDGPVLLDWDLLCAGPRAWDHAPMLSMATRWGGSPAWYPAFAAGYGRSLADDPVAQALAELRLVAATLMRLRAGRDDPAAMPEAQRRLAYWRGDPDAPQWTAV